MPGTRKINECTLYAPNPYRTHPYGLGGNTAYDAEAVQFSGESKVNIPTLFDTNMQ